MAHFAQLDENNVVIQVIVVSNAECLDPHYGIESEATGVTFCKSLFGYSTEWKQTSYSGALRKHFAGIGYTYDAALNAFIPPKPFASWLFDLDTCQWKAPIPYPDDGLRYSWDEDTLSWKEQI